MPRSRVGHVNKVKPHGFQGMKVRPLTARGEKEMTAYHIRFKRGMAIPPSYHKRAHEIIVVLSGAGTAHLDGRRVPLRAGSTVRIEPGVRHAFSTRSKAMEILAFLNGPVNETTDLFHD